MSKRLTFLFFLLFLISFHLSAQQDSTVNKKIYKTVLKYIYEKDFIYGKPDRFYLDSSVSTIHHVNPALDQHYNYLGTNGSASEPQFFSLTDPLFTATSIRSYDIQLLSNDSIRAYRTNKRFTELNYHNGNFKEQRISVLHTQNINLHWNAGIYFDREGTKEYMSFSNTFRSRFAIYTWYYTPNKKYNLFANLIWNAIRNGVNGGLTSDSLFDNTTVSNLGIKGLAYQIANASHSLRKKNFFLSQYYDLRKSVKDSSEKNVPSGPIIRLHHQLNMERKSYVYKDSDADSSFYSDFYYGAETYDSLHSDEITNRVAVQLAADTGSKSAFFRNWSSGLFTEYQYMKYGQKSDSSWHNLSAGANVLLKSDSSKPEIFAEAVYVANGMDKGNYKGELKALSTDFSFGRFGINIKQSRSSSDLIYRWYDSNNFRWINNFNSVKSLQTILSYELEKYHLKIEAAHTTITGYVYLDYFALPAQYNEKLIIDQLRLFKNFKWHFWHFDNKIYFQKTDREGIIHLPTLVTDQSLYFEKPYYGNALLAAFGVSANYNSSYNANEFMPATGMFYLQNSVNTGGYLRFDLFINAQIKTARIFLKFENIADDLIKKSYYLTPHYPMPGRILKFGVIWRFFDQ